VLADMHSEHVSKHQARDNRHRNFLFQEVSWGGETGAEKIHTETNSAVCVWVVGGGGRGGGQGGGVHVNAGMTGSTWLTRS